MTSHTSADLLFFEVFISMLNPITSKHQLHHHYRAYAHTEFAARAASQAWLGMGGQGIGERGFPSLIPGEPPLLMVSVLNEIG